MVAPKKGVMPPQFAKNAAVKKAAGGKGKPAAVKGDGKLPAFLADKFAAKKAPVKGVVKGVAKPPVKPAVKKAAAGKAAKKA